VAPRIESQMMPNKLKKLIIEEISLVPEGANQAAHIVISKNLNRKGTTQMSDDLKNANAAYIAQIAKLTVDLKVQKSAAEKMQADFKTQGEQLEKLIKKSLDNPGPTAPLTQEDITKSLAPEAVAYIKAISDKLVDAVKSEKDSTARIATLEKASKEKSIVDDLSKYAASIDIPAVSKMLMSADEATATTIHSMLKQLDTVSDHLTKSLGVSSLPADSSGSFGKAEVLAKALRTVNPSLSKDQALAKVWQDNPDLYNDATN